MTPEQKPKQERRLQRPDADLDRRYGAIGIPAVAAAVRFVSATRAAEPPPRMHEAAPTDRAA